MAEFDFNRTVNVLLKHHNTLTSPPTTLPSSLQFPDIHVGSMHREENSISFPESENFFPMNNQTICESSCGFLPGPLEDNFFSNNIMSGGLETLSSFSNKRHTQVSPAPYLENSTPEPSARENEPNQILHNSVQPWFYPDISTDTVLLNDLQNPLSTVTPDMVSLPFDYGLNQTPTLTNVPYLTGFLSSLSCERGLGNQLAAYEKLLNVCLHNADSRSNIFSETVSGPQTQELCQNNPNTPLKEFSQDCGPSASNSSASRLEVKMEANVSRSPSVKSEPQEDRFSENSVGVDEMEESIKVDKADREAIKMENKRIRRMISNRESARRSRMKRQQLMLKLEVESAELRIKNAALQKKAIEALKHSENCRIENEKLALETENLKEELNKLKRKKEKVKELEESRPANQKIKMYLEDQDRTGVLLPLKCAPFLDSGTFTACEPLLVTGMSALINTQAVYFDRFTNLHRSKALVEV